jgi:hypothetical protein
MMTKIFCPQAVSWYQLDQLDQLDQRAGLIGAKIGALIVLFIWH